MRLRCKADTYQEVTRTKLTVFKMERLDFASEAKLLLKDIYAYPGIEPPFL